MEESAPVQVIESCLVAPATPTPTNLGRRLWLSPLDVALANTGRTSQIFLYRSGAAVLDVARLKAAMAKALVAYYPLAGRLIGNDDDDGGKVVEISCNDEGALFVVARSSCLTAQDVDFSKPSPELKTLFVPSIGDPQLILATQVTLLKCGAVVLGVSMHHGLVDGVSASHFMQTWSALYRDGDDDGAKSTVVANGDDDGAKSTVVAKDGDDDGAKSTVKDDDDELPCHDHTLLRARSPPVVHPDALSVLYYPKVTATSPSSTTTTSTTTELFPISRDQLVTLKRLCSGGGGAAPASTFVSLSALVWQCTTIVRQLPPDATTRLSFPVHVQRYMKPPLPPRYFGNATISVCATATAGDITAGAAEALPSIAARISRVMAKVDDELVRSAIDYVELADEGTWPRCRGGKLPETDLRVVSWLNMPFGLDLGCGEGSGGPQAMTRAETIPHGLVYLVDNYGPANHGGVGVVVRMEDAEINHFKRLLYASLASN